MRSILIKDTTREEREQIVAESIGNVNGSCDGCMAGIAEMYAYDEAKNKASVGVRLARKYWHQGIAMEAVCLMKEYLEDTIRIRTIRLVSL